MPLPEGPTTASRVEPTSRATSSATRRSRPKKYSAWAASKGARPRNGQTAGCPRSRRFLDRVEAGALAGHLQVDDAAGDRGLCGAQLGAIVGRPVRVRGQTLGGLRASPLAGGSVDAQRHPLALGEQCPHGDDDALGGIEGGDLGRRILAQRVEAQALGGARLQQGGKRRRALLVVMKDADQERAALGLAGQGRGGLEDRGRGVVGVVEDEERRSVARGGLGDGRQRRHGEFATAGVEDRGALALDLGGELGHQPRLADPGRPPDHHADDPALARPRPAPAQPVKLALAPGEQRRAALELGGELDDRRRRVEARVLGEDLLLQAA